MGAGFAAAYVIGKRMKDSSFDPAACRCSAAAG
jgi:hypothetical protein